MRYVLGLALGACVAPAPDSLLDKDDPAVDSEVEAVDTEVEPVEESDEPPVDDTEPPTDWEELPPVATLPASAVADLGEAIDDVLARSDYTAGVVVVDLDAGQVLYTLNPDLPLKPASNTKLFTTAALYGLLGEDERSTLRAYGGQAPDAQGRVAQLYVVSRHDWTWSTFFYDYPEWPADQLAEQLVDAGVTEVGALTVRGEGLFEGYQFATYDAAAHRADLLAAMESALELQGVVVQSTSSDGSFEVPAGAVPLASQDALPFSVATHPINEISHNEMADIASRHLGEQLQGESSYEAGADELIAWLFDLGIDTAGLELNDGSGLSHFNRVTARSIVDLQTVMYEHPAGAFWRATFSVAGRSGTLASRMTGGETAGRFWGKSGTLTGVIATSGVLHHAHDGHRYLISVLMNEVDYPSVARDQQDDVVAAVAEDWRGRGDRPAEPVLRLVRPAGAGRLFVDWDEVDDAEGYEVWVADQARVWSRSQARWVRGDSELELTGLSDGRTYFVRVVARNEQGMSEPSDVYVGTAVAGGAELLLVDGNDRYETQWENRLQHGHGFVADVGEALHGYAVASAANEAVEAGEVSLGAHEAVVWLLGEESTDDETFSPVERALVEAYLGAGGGLLVSGAELGWDLDYLGDADEQGFFRDGLRAVYVGDDAGSMTARPTGSGLFAGLGDLGFYRPGWMEVDYPDRLSPGIGAQAVLSYVGGAGGTAAVAYAGVGRTVVLGFPVETIDTAASREAVLQRAVGFLTQ